MATPADASSSFHPDIDLTNRYFPRRPSLQGRNPRAKYTRRPLAWSRSKLMKIGSPSDIDDHRRYLFSEQQRQQREQREREARGPRFHSPPTPAAPAQKQKKAQKLVTPHFLTFLEGMRTRQGNAYIAYRCSCCYEILSREARAAAARWERKGLYEEGKFMAKGGWGLDLDGEWEVSGWEDEGARAAREVMGDLVRRPVGFRVRWKGGRGKGTEECWTGDGEDSEMDGEEDMERVEMADEMMMCGHQKPDSVVDSDDWLQLRSEEWVVIDDDVESVWSMVDSVVEDSES